MRKWMDSPQRPTTSPALRAVVRGELGAVVAPAAIHQVVDLVDHQDDVRKVFAGAEGGERYVRIEDVVVITDSDLDPVRKLQAHFEGANLGREGGAVDVVRLDGGVGVVDLREDSRGDELDPVVLGEAAVLPRGRGSDRWRTSWPWPAAQGAK